MRQRLILFTLLILSVNVNIFACEGTPDLLIIGKDTIRLYVYKGPLEQLEMKYRPFDSKTVSMPCVRGYRAIWKMVDNRLFLEKITNCVDSSLHEKNKKYYKEENIVDFFEKNNIQYQEKNGMIFADWCTMNFYNVVFDPPYPVDLKELFDIEDREEWWKKRPKRFVLQIENGIVTRHKL